MTGDARRLFFAAWPAAGVQRALGALGRKLARECGGRAVPARNIHLTLVFLGAVERARLEALQSLAAAVTAPRMALVVDRVEYWRHNRILWAGVAECPPALRQLVERLERPLGAAGYRLDARAYVPHITLVRDARRAPRSATIGAIAWPVAGFALVESMPMGRARRYRVLREWPLGA